MLANKLGHRAEPRVLNDGFQTTALWGQFSGITDDMFEPVWRYTTQDGTSTRRDLYTLHLWGDGHWIWVIRLSKGRVSVGITFDQKKMPPGGNPRELFFAALAEYPVFDGVLSRENLLEFRMYRNVQHLTDTFYSLTTSRGSLSSLRATNLIWRTWFESVHSRNSKLATNSGLIQMHSFILAAVNPCPHLPLFASGRFWNGQSGTTSFCSRA